MTWNASSIYMQAGWRKHKQNRDHEREYWTVPQCEITPTLFLFGFLQLVKVYLLQVEGMGGLPVVLLLCSFHGTAAKQNTQIILFNYGWVPACLFLCRKTLPSCGFCSTALVAVTQEPQPGKPPSRVSLQTRTRWVAGPPFPLSPGWCLSTLTVSFRFQLAPRRLQPPYLWVSRRPSRPCEPRPFTPTNLLLGHLSLQTAGRRCTPAPGCIQFTGPSSSALVPCASTGDAGLQP